MNHLSPELHQFFGGSFHQDWTLDHETADDVVQAFVAEATPHERLMVARALKDLLDLPDESLGEAIFALGAYYDPTADGLTVRQWLESLVRNILVPDMSSAT
jgi:hypothetical protein